MFASACVNRCGWAHPSRPSRHKRAQILTSQSLRHPSDDFSVSLGRPRADHDTSVHPACFRHPHRTQAMQLSHFACVQAPHWPLASVQPEAQALQSTNIDGAVRTIAGVTVFPRACNRVPQSTRSPQRFQWVEFMRPGELRSQSGSDNALRLWHAQPCPWQARRSLSNPIRISPASEHSPKE